MKRVFNLAFGSVCVLVGVGMGGWIAYNQFVEMQPQVEGKNPLRALVFSALFIYVGVTRIRKAMRTSEPAGPA
jgi:alpha-beta hydrolase superfamily lysophospholipase